MRAAMRVSGRSTYGEGGFHDGVHERALCCFLVFYVAFLYLALLSSTCVNNLRSHRQ
jgi:hypothetical protein